MVNPPNKLFNLTKKQRVISLRSILAHCILQVNKGVKWQLKVNMDYNEYYNIVFAPIEKEYGKFDEETMTSIVGFSMGGPVSMSSINSKRLYASCELSVYPEQKKSTDGYNFEFLSTGHFNAETCQSIFTALGNLSFNAKLGNGHTVDVSGVVDDESVSLVKLSLFSCSEYLNEKIAIYEVSPA
ncbi:hypothetical protein KP803_00010 [Vibrio sp. ZSDE26]|uniref:Uncharacterized protein n=1 Tax=Vibrio amylolyticus TaxID=2847292 RepID=A0A9X2BGA4_9VIBR|nr:hypothetical protein [Vibrio amylolyticus]MCK6261650.1 hypothetical protein [Vibrio amylolyticus]